MLISNLITNWVGPWMTTWAKPSSYTPSCAAPVDFTCLIDGVENEITDDNGIFIVVPE